jgi:hypothetical protein
VLYAIVFRGMPPPGSPSTSELPMLTVAPHCQTPQTELLCWADDTVTHVFDHNFEREREKGQLWMNSRNAPLKPKAIQHPAQLDYLQSPIPTITQ